MKYSLLVLSILFLSSSIQARQPHYKFGDVPRAHLEQEIFSIDSSASAVVLFDVGESYLDTDLKLHTTHHVRIKILTDEGLQKGDISIGYRDGDPTQSVRKVRAASYNLNSKGKIITSKLGRRDTYKEKVSDSWNELKFSIPGLQKGSVFEYSYEIVSASPVDLKGWQFQRDVPVLWSAYTANIPEWFNYRSLIKSYYPMYIQEQSPMQGKALLKRSPGSMRSQFLDYNGTKYVWAMKDLPALKDEPYTNSARDYSAKVILQLNTIQFPNSMPQTVLNDWVELIDILEKSSRFGKRIKSNSLFRNIAELHKNQAKTNEELIANLYTHVSETMTWNEAHRLYLSDDLKSLYEQGSANGTEINMILVQLLRDAGLDADPVILSTRSNGEILEIIPIIDQFNHAIAYVKLDSTEYLLDAKDKDLPHDLLPISTQNGNGLLVNKEAAAWIPLLRAQKAAESTLIALNFSNDGYTGELSSKFTGHLSYSNKKNLEEEDPQQILHKSIFTNSTVEIDTVTFDDTDQYSYSYNIIFNDSSAITETDILYINPIFSKGIDTNPFKKEERYHPVDFNFPFSQQIVVNMSLPEGWEIDEIPEGKVVALPDGLGHFRRIIQATGNERITMLYNLQINTYKIMPEQYPYLREMYQHIVQSSSENIVLKRL